MKGIYANKNKGISNIRKSGTVDSEMGENVNDSNASMIASEEDFAARVPNEKRLLSKKDFNLAASQRLGRPSIAEGKIGSKSHVEEYFKSAGNKAGAIQNSVEEISDSDDGRDHLQHRGTTHQGGVTDIMNQ